MAFNFPTNPSTNDRYPQEGDTAGLEKTGGVIYKYDGNTNSWNIVGPDNIATTDWVKAQFKDDSTAIDRGYDILGSTNEITIDANYSYNASRDEENVNLESGIRTDVIDPDGPQNDYEESLDKYLTEWETDSIDNSIPGLQSVAVAGIDYQYIADGNMSANIFSTKYKDIVDFLVSVQDRNQQNLNYLADCGVGDTIEINYEGSDGNLEYAVYKLRKKVEVDANHWGIRVKFEAASNPETRFKSTSSATSYNFKFYKKAFTTEGGEFSGPIHVVVDDGSALMVKPVDLNADTLLNVDTLNNDVTINQEHDVYLDFVGTKSDFSVVTLGHLNRRLGVEGVEDHSKGPYLRLAGGTLGGRLNIEREGGEGTHTFKISGKRGSSLSTGDFFYIKGTAGEADDMILEGRGEDSKAVLNKTQIEELTTSAVGNFLKKDGDAMTKGYLTLKNDPTNDMHASTKKYVDDHPLIISDYTDKDPPTRKGQLYSYAGTLYWNKS